MTNLSYDFPRTDGSVAIGFDADNTLWNFDKVLETALDRTVAEFERLSPQTPRGALVPSRIQATRSEIVSSLGGETIALEEIRLKSIALSLLELGISQDDLVIKLTEYFFNVRFDEIELFEEVRAVVDGLRMSGYALGLLTNGNTDPDRCGLSGIFRSIVYATEIGFPKPDPRSFEMMAAELGVDAEKLIYIGDSEIDVIGANAAGAILVLVNRSGERLPFSGQARFEIQSLDQLALVLDEVSHDLFPGAMP